MITMSFAAVPVGFAFYDPALEEVFIKSTPTQARVWVDHTYIDESLCAFDSTDVVQIAS